MKSFSQIGLAAFLIIGSACVPNKTPPPPAGNGEQPGIDQRPGEDGLAKPSDPGDSGVEAQLRSLDVVLVVALSATRTNHATQIENEIISLQNKLAAMASSRNVRYILFGSPVSQVSDVGVRASGFDPAQTKQIRFELDAAKAFFGPLIASCTKDASEMADPHLPTKVKVCGETITVPGHAWTWALDDLRGVAHNFLRPNTDRLLITVSNGDAEFLDANHYLSFMQRDQTGAKIRAYSITPDGQNNGMCGQYEKEALEIKKLSTLTGGRDFSFCASEWGSYAATIVKDLQ